MEKVGTSETLIPVYGTMRRHITNCHISSEVVFPYYGLITRFILSSAAKGAIWSSLDAVSTPAAVTKQ